jgi:hypothetical protein
MGEPMRKTMSLKQIAANRRNAQKSTGPQTPAGRAVSKMNALKHGILSKEVVVRGRCIKEDDREFAALNQQLWEDLNPVGLAGGNAGGPDCDRALAAAAGVEGRSPAKSP